MQTISRDMIANYHSQQYVGENIVVVAAGDLDHAEVVEAVEKSFRVPAKSSNPVSLEKPRFCPGVSTLPSTLTDKVNMVIVHEAPSFFEGDFFSYLLLQRIVSDRPENPFELEIMKSNFLNSQTRKASSTNSTWLNTPSSTPKRVSTVPTGTPASTATILSSILKDSET